MDSTYLELIGLRRKLIAEEADEVVGFNPIARDAVHELFLWIFGTYLPKRYPNMFKLVHRAEIGKGRGLPIAVRNLVLDETIILNPIPEPSDCLKVLGCHVDCEFAILLPIAPAKGKVPRIDPTDCPKTPYHLHAFILAFPSGFTTSQKLGLPLAGMMPMLFMYRC